MTLVTISIWDYIDKFKNHCYKSKNWKVYEGEDLIQVKNKFHKFVWIQHVRPFTFESMITNPLCAIREGVSYRTVRISFMAWVLPQPPAAAVLRLFEENPDISKWVALYDLSRISKDLPACSKLNETKSVVFQEFERFLSNCYGIELEPSLKLRTTDHQARASRWRLINTEIFA